ncbi:GHMP kinase [Bradyrhizobium sp. B097]|uniref:GHMP family kinase ATP-binding protein n=1 Tax=Bradyrhizobium sp. B097 TaxID=3140244 RepID=UPI003182E6F1
MLERRAAVGVGCLPPFDPMVRESPCRLIPPQGSQLRAGQVARDRAVGYGMGHHGEILQGAFRDGEGQMRRGLVTLPFPVFNSVAWAVPTEGRSIEIDPPEKTKALRAVALLLNRIGERSSGLSVRIRSNIPIGYGLGSSTADIVAALTSAASALGASLCPADLLKLAVSAEQASDGTMFTSRAVLAAHREGVLLEEFARPLPPMGLISINSSPDNPLLTLDFPPAPYETTDVDHFDDLRRTLRQAVAEGDQALLAKVATESALINQRYLPQPGLPDILDIARANGALGIQVAHSGRMLGLILPANLDRFDRPVSTIMGGLQELGAVPMFISRL